MNDNAFETLTRRSGDLEFTALAAGPTDGPLVVFVHGFPDGPETFASQLTAFGAHGYRAIAPTLRGYEPSSVPADGDHSLITLADDVAGWLDHLGVQAAHLVGHDWGAAITYTAAARHPDRFTSASTMAVPPLPRIPQAVRRVPKQLVLSWYMTFFQLRWISERAASARDHALIAWFWKRWSPGYDLDEDAWVGLRKRFAEPGVLTSTLRYYRQNATPLLLMGLKTNEAMDLTTVEAPTLVLHGSDDGCMTPKLFSAVHDIAVEAGDFPGGLRREEVPGCGHFLHLEQPDEISERILEHIVTSSAPGEG